MIEVKPAVDPLGYQQVLDLHASCPGMLITRHSQDVAIVNHAQLRILRHVQQFAGDIGKAHTLLLAKGDGLVVLFVIHLGGE